MAFFAGLYWLTPLDVVNKYHLSDKSLHFTMFFLAAVAIFFTLMPHHKNPLILAGPLFSLALLAEGLQIFDKTRTVSLSDFAFNVLGIATGIGVFMMWRVIKSILRARALQEPERPSYTKLTLQ